MELTTIPDVEIVSTGTYNLNSGETTFTADDLADAVRAMSDPTIVAPRIKLGHFDKRFEASGEGLDGEPAFGQIANPRLANNGQTIKGDLVNVPVWLKAAMPSSFPGRSIEGGFNFTAPSGHRYRLVVSDLALLGTEWPGITSLADLKTALSDAGGELLAPAVAASGGGFEMAGGTALSVFEAPTAPEPVEARLNVSDFRRVFAADLTAGKVPKVIEAGDQTRWWTRSVEAGEGGTLSLVIDDAAGKLIELPVKVEGDALVYGAPSLREAVAASHGRRVLASWPNSGESPASGGDTVEVDASVLRTRLGLPEDADEAAITEALATAPAAETAPVAASAGNVPEGMVLVDGETWESVKAGAEAGRTVAVTLAERERDDTIIAAIGAGKFPAGRREHYEAAWSADPEGTRTLIASLADGLVPGAEIGRAGDGEGDTSTEDALVAGFEARAFPELGIRTTATSGGVR